MNYTAIVKICIICVGFSYLAIVTGGQHEAKASKKSVAVMNFVAKVQNLQQHTSKKLSLG